MEKIYNYRIGTSAQIVWTLQTRESEGRMWSAVKKSRPATTEKTGPFIFLPHYTC